MFFSKLLIIMLMITTVWLYGYELPLPGVKAQTQTVVDIDHDGDQDLILACDGIAYDLKAALLVLKNDGLGNFSVADTLLDNGGFYVKTGLINDNSEEDIVYSAKDPNNKKLVYKVVYDYHINGWNNIGELNFIDEVIYPSQENLELYYKTPDSRADVLFLNCRAAGNQMYWGQFINDGNGNFTKARRHNFNYNIIGILSSIETGDLNSDGLNDIAFGSSDMSKLNSWLAVDSGLVYQNILDSSDNNSLQIRDLKIIDVDNDDQNEIAGFSDLGMDMVMTYDRLPNGKYKKSYTRWGRFSVHNWITADLNNDSLPEFIYANDIDNTTGIDSLHILNNKNGTFPFTPQFSNTGASSHSPCSADFDGDGWQDIAVLNFITDNWPNSAIRVLFNNHQGGFSEHPVGIESSSENSVTDYKLQNYPNPFNNSTKINYDLPTVNRVNLAIYNAKGELVRQLINASQHKGVHSIDFNATGLNSGVYYYRLQTSKNEICRKMILLK